MPGVRLGGEILKDLQNAASETDDWPIEPDPVPSAEPPPPAASEPEPPDEAG
jgi:hypothetical protein